MNEAYFKKMNRQLKCFLSASYGTDLSLIKSVLAENDIVVFDLYDFSIDISIQQILKRKLREADFAVFVVGKESNNILYEIGVCEGLGKQSLIIIDKSVNLPFYLANKLSLTANLNDRNFLKMILCGFIEEMKHTKKSVKNNILEYKKEVEEYNTDIKEILTSLLEHTINIRENGSERELEHIVEEIFKTIHLKYADNTKSPDVGIDFALWSDKLGRILGNPIIVEIKFGHLGQDTFSKAEQQIQRYAEKSEAKVALLLYLDKTGKRFELSPSLNPLIIAYDIENFIADILESNFENVILTSRNKIVHGQ